jgi:hypothetical protein
MLKVYQNWLIFIHSLNNYFENVLKVQILGKMAEGECLFFGGGGAFSPLVQLTVSISQLVRVAERPTVFLCVSVRISL